MDNTNVTMDMKAVNQLLELLKENQKTQEIGMIQNLSSTINDMESNLISMFSQLQDVKNQLNMVTVTPPMQEVKQAAIKEVEKSEKSLDKLKGQLNGVKKKFMDTVKTTLDKTKETGVLALDKLSEFTGMKQNLIYLNSAINHSVGNLDKSIASVNALSVELNATGSHLKNIGRVIIGKDTQEHISEGKGIFAKPLEGVKKSLITMKEKSNIVISKLDNLYKEKNKQPEIKPLIEPQKPSVIEKLKEKPQPKQVKVKVKTKVQNMER